MFPAVLCVLQKNPICYTGRMEKKQKGGVELMRFKNLSAFAGIGHFVSTRKGGVSNAPFNALNLALHVGDEKTDVLENRKLLAEVLGLKIGGFVFMQQVHEGKVAVVGKQGRSRGAFEHENALEGTDAMITNAAGVCLVVQVADCVPVLLFDPVQKVVGVAHAGWRGTMKGIVQKTVEKMKSEFCCSPQDIVAGIGPSIGPCCYEATDEDLLSKWERMFQAKDKVVVARKGKMFLDLWQANKVQLMQSGVGEGNIEFAGICTSCHMDEFYSYKKERITGRFAAGIVLNAKSKKQKSK
jgi:YfiH family protein